MISAEMPMRKETSNVSNVIKLNFVTGNKHKYEEVMEFFQRFNVKVRCKNVDIDLVEPQWDTLEEVAAFKVKNAQEQISGGLFIEDAGFFVASLNGFPGVYSSYCHKTIGNEGMLNLLRDKQEPHERKAYFKSVIAVKFEHTDEIELFVGKVSGTVSMEMRGNNGFGYDPIFIPDENPQYTFAELSIDQKNKISHRANAIRKMAEYLREKSI